MRPWRVFALFAVLVVLVAGAVLWFSWRILELDDAQRRLRAAELVDSACSRAMWRLEYAAGSLVLQEAARPYWQYQALIDRSRPYGRPEREPPPRDTLDPSPLLGRFVPFTRLHFQIHPDHQSLGSPQVVDGPLREFALTRGLATEDALQRATARLAALERILAADPLTRRMVQEEGGPAGRAPEESGLVDANSPRLLHSLAEWRGRREPSARAAGAGNAQGVEEGLLRALWAGEALVLARLVKVDGVPYIQGCWLDWQEIEAELLADIRGLLPDARLEPEARRGPAVAAADDLRLVALPVALVPGAVPVDDAALAAPIRQSLAVALAAVIAAIVAVAVLLRVTLLSGARQAEFASAVTHELRTPLTTLRMYADLLAEGRVDSPEKRQRYYETLRREADRLGLLVDNVLSWSRLQAARSTPRREQVCVGELIDRVAERCRERAAQAGLRLVVQQDASAAIRVVVDGPAVEQILFNLVDNACKYAADALDATVELSCHAPTQGLATIRVRDHGPGIAVADARGLFRPFTRARGAARRQPGIGLGLSLARRLAREMGGELRLDPSLTDGAAFEIRLPVAGSAESP